MMKRKRSLLQNNRGLAIEMAVSFMLVTFALCAILLTVAFNTNARNTRVYNTTNDYFTLDQLGEFFVRALETNQTVDFMKDIYGSDGKVVQNDPNKVRGGWFKYINGEGSTTTEFALNLSTNDSRATDKTVRDGVYTLRVTYWDCVNWSESTKKASVNDSDLLLIVTVQKKGSTYNIVNWSNQLLDVQGAIKDVAPAENLSFIQILLNILKSLLNLIISGGTVLLHGFQRIIDIIF